MLLEGRTPASFIKERHARQVRGLDQPPRLAIVRQGATAATDQYLRVKQRYGEDIGVPVETFTEKPDGLMDRIHSLNEDSAVTGIIMQLPLVDPALTEAALDAIAPDKDVDGLGARSPFEAATPKAILWLLAAYNIDLKSPVAVVGQGRLVGQPLTQRLRTSGVEVIACDVDTPDLAAAVAPASVIVSATGQAHLITSGMVKPGMVVVDAGAPHPDAAPELSSRTDIKLTPTPGGVGPMTVAALFDNLLIAAGR